MPQKPLTVVAHIKARPGKESRTREELIKLIEPTRREDGCIQYDLHFSQSDPTEFLFFEIWSDAAALARHSQSTHLLQFRELGDQLLAEPTRVTLWDPFE